MTDHRFRLPFDIFLIGDTGAIAKHKPDPVMQMLRDQIMENANSAVVFLGDNAYPRGLPPEGNILRKEAEIILNKHKEALDGYDGRVIFISGNHDWNNGRRNGLDYLLRQEQYLGKLFDDRQVMLPKFGCPGPEVVDIAEGVVLVLINTQWWMQKGIRPVGPAFGCTVHSDEDFFSRLEQVFIENREKRILVAGHAPIYSYAIHGGRFKLKHHLFPFTLYHRKAYVPVPVIGSLLPLYRKFIGAKEDIAHPRYRRLRHKLKNLFKQYPGIIYAAGHEHNLQYITKDGGHFIVSGAGSKLKYVIEEGRHLRFGLQAKGFFKLRFGNDGSVLVEAWAVDRKTSHGKKMYEKQLMQPAER
ncbi:MAG TPA: metallophosphoesterase [Sphingobacteriaceae bacterium]